MQYVGRCAAVLFAVSAAADMVDPCEQYSETACPQTTGCLWGQVWEMTGCSTDPCYGKNTYDECLQQSKVVTEGGCTNMLQDNEACIVDVCAFHSTTSFCELKKCMHLNEQACNADTANHCDWKWEGLPANTSGMRPGELLPHCQEDMCGSASGEASCIGYRGCKWAMNTCVEDQCSMHIDEATCGGAAQCEWASEMSPPCSSDYCSHISGNVSHPMDAVCTDDSKCMYVEGLCLKKVCEKKHTSTHDLCPCKSDDDCAWDTEKVVCTEKKYKDCPDMDIAVLLDGSGSMHRSFGNHPHGFYGLIGILREWVEGVPLSGDNHLKKKNASPKGIRVTFVQFSLANVLPEMDHSINCAVGECTNGYLSGNEKELQGELSWAEQHFQGGWTYLCTALKDASENAFAESPSWRKKVLLIIADGGLTDYDGDSCKPDSCGNIAAIDRKFLPAYTDRLITAQSLLKDEGVTIFGIVMRRFNEHTFEDRNAEEKLKKLVTSPQDEHFLNVLLDDIPDKVLLSLCDPTTTFGKNLAHKGALCGEMPESVCHQSPKCFFSEIMVSCAEDTVCFPICNDNECVAAPECRWNEADATCLRNPTTPSPPTQEPLPYDPTPAPPTYVPTPAPVIDECVEHGYTCTEVGQVCVDKKQTVNGTWVCECQLPWQGEAVAEVAECLMNECIVMDSNCTNVGQMCKDPDWKVVDNWECTCKLPQIGESAVMGPATCAVPPPTDCDKGWRVCSAGNQHCDSGLNETDGNYTCECLPPATGEPVENGLATCFLDECLMDCPHCAGDACKDQTCLEGIKDPLNTEDWSCLCIAPKVGSKVAKRATCVADECTVTCPTCADDGSGRGNLCAGAGQTCKEHSTSKDYDWECICPPPLIADGYFRAEVSLCRVDECVENEEVCTRAHQVCHDPTGATGDWRCECQYPYEGDAPMQAARCSLDECNTAAAKDVCTKAGQTCHDPDKDTQGNFECVCKAPSSGYAVAHPAPECQLDECVEECKTCADSGEGNVCTKKDQTCDDPNPLTASLGDWQCACKEGPQKQTGEAVPKCHPGYDECEQPSSAVIECVHEPRFTDAGCQCQCGWELLANDCGYPGCPGAQGPGSAGDPCTTGCCNPDQDIADWCFIADNAYNRETPGCNIVTDAKFGYCTGKGTLPANGGPKLRPSIPTVPDSQNNKCTDVVQMCLDPDMWSLEDWQCQCVFPKSGPLTTKGKADCVTDECNVKGSTCTAKEQDCVDTNTADNSLDDWECRCGAGISPTNATRMAPTSCHLDECLVACPTCAFNATKGSDVCTDIDQACSDPSPIDTSLGDWTCTCAPPAQGQTRGSPATCVLNECVEKCDTCADKGTGNVCTDAMQLCEDPNTSPFATADWSCKCHAPSNTSSLLSAALCMVNECAEDPTAMPKCPVDQKCVDKDFQTQDDWVCECVLPARGQGLQTAAVCLINECAATVNSEKCTDAGQVCADPSQTTADDWVCECIAPDTGDNVTMAAANCTVGEECVNNTICSDVGQQCVDPTSAVGDWECLCIAPKHGSAVVGAPATCELDECVDICPSCQKQAQASVGECEKLSQICEEPDKLISWDWKCKCQAPLKGEAVGEFAPCTLNECEEVCDTCEMDACSDATPTGQTCTDPDQSEQSVGDWLCYCPPPSGTVTAHAPNAVCHQNECATKGTICANGGQICADRSPAVHDWECLCTPPSVGSALAGTVSDCGVNECTAVCPTCADTGSGNVCSLQEQDCEDPDLYTESTWVCKCFIGAGQMAGAAVAECPVDECVDICASCATTPLGNICEMNMQACEDPVKTESSLNDWRCLCQGNGANGTFAVATAADCDVDECTMPVDGKVGGDMCTDKGHVCFDPDKAELNNFVCSCPPPQQGSRTMAIAPCTLDECKVHINTCRNVGQACVDPDTTVDDNWSCMCVAPKVGQNLMAAVVACEEDECLENAVVCEAVTPSQLCVDTDRFTNNTWECQCREPMTGSKPMAQAVCHLNECTADCASCEQDVCSKLSQICKDLDTSATSLYDWTCNCELPAQGVATANAAQCRRDECEEPVPKATCANAGQSCSDNGDPDSLGDWRCECAHPTKGAAIGGSATCTHDECQEHGHVCTDKGQTCHDQDTSVGSVGDWECTCTPPAQEKKTGAPAECTYVGECTLPTINDICMTAGQACQDQDETESDDWECVCVAPSRGVPALGGVATCVLDECLEACATCAGNTCKDKDQTCVDVNKDPVTGLNSWECKCKTPYSGTGVAKAATCVVNECDIDDSVCKANGQTCIDPDNTVLGDWECACKPPATGVATGLPAKCIVDECGDNEPTCAAAGQLCLDPNRSPTSLGDWQCECVHPKVGVANSGVASCDRDECATYGGICVNNRQKCLDTDTTTDNTWYCYCPAPFQDVFSFGGLADCEVDECTEFTPYSAVKSVGDMNVCEKEGQGCTDPQQAIESYADWMCLCQSPSSTFAVAAPAAYCSHDECADPQNNATCTDANQDCFDPTLDAAGDWLCVCRLPAVGQATASVATCEEDECATKGGICSPVSQFCEDSQRTTYHDWYCVCINDATKRELMQEVSCEPPTGSECLLPENEKVCTDAGHVCVDPDQTRDNDWQCVCTPPSTGVAGIRAPATCSLDECADTCPTCAGTVCSDRGQECKELSTSANDKSDWSCVCPPPSTGSQQGAAATCELNECTALCPTCADKGTGNPCEALDQECVDPDTDARVTNDWLCLCKEPASGNRTGRAAICIIDECELHGATCPPGQACFDTLTSASSLGDWGCVCDPPAVGTGHTSAAHCALNECDLTPNAETCTDAGQKCLDPMPKPSSLNDWECHCTQGNSFAVGAFAPVCDFNECEGVCHSCADKGAGNVCEEAKQTCEDPVKTLSSINDWMCVCPEGQTANLGPAACKVDECATKSGICIAVKQICKDVDQVHFDNWVCECIPPQTGAPGLTATAECSTNECELYQQVCTLEGQICEDPNPFEDGDWVCKCPQGSLGVGKTSPATCSTDGECVEQGHICKQVGQACVDPDVHTDDDWMCECVSPATGAAKVAHPATCTVNECATQCDTCADKGLGNVCDTAGQTCVEGSVDPMSRGDWECVCPTGSTGSALAAVATCEIDECLVDKEKNKKICGTKSQDCVDTDRTTPDNWQCVCLAPAQGKATKKNAVCTVDECLKDEVKNVCKFAGQECEDINPNALDTWYCVCPTQNNKRRLGHAADCSPPPGWCETDGHICQENGQGCVNESCTCLTPEVGTSVLKGVAVCTLDECSATCPTCANTGNGNVCTEAGQSCVEGSNAVQDWSCVCDEGFGIANLAVATCTLNECDEHGSVCEDGGQSCVDPTPSPSTTGDWFCECTSADATKKVGGLASCHVDECATFGIVCEDGTQMCQDTDKTTQGNWECLCPPPSKGSHTAGLATCEQIGECQFEPALSTCAPLGQVCVDPTDMAGDWHCACVYPQTPGAPTMPMGMGRDASALSFIGGGPGGFPDGMGGGDPTFPGPPKIAPCVLDECTAVCATCSQKPGMASGACVGAQQECEDPIQDPVSVNDWICKCKLPATGSAKGAAAQCEVDECEENASVCEGAQVDDYGYPAQRCVDPSHSTTGDWQCVCDEPYRGAVGHGEPTVCLFDECSVSFGEQPTGNTICAEEGQECHDAQQGITQTENWVCKCPNSDVVSALAPATCETVGLCSLNSCPAGQYCTDDGTQWSCECVEPAYGFMTGGPAICEYDECWDFFDVCPEGQMCFDNNASVASKGDWGCKCQEGAGQALAGVAECTIDECAEAANNASCAAHHQTCVDPDTSANSLGDWECRCEAPAFGKGVAGRASCTLDECVVNGDTCTSVGQTCKDTNISLSSVGDWMCVCPLGSTSNGITYAAHANCTHASPCDTEVNKRMCTDAGQSCVPSGSGFKCACVAPSTGMPGVGVPAECSIDECNDVCATCARTNAGAVGVCKEAGQTCVDPNKLASSLQDWTCACKAPSTQTAIAARVPECTFDECTSTGNGTARPAPLFNNICEEAGQECVDANPSPNSRGDWTCKCKDSENVGNLQLANCGMHGPPPVSNLT